CFTDQRIIVKKGSIAMNIESIYYSELIGVNLHIGIIERIFKVGDIYISTTNQSVVLEDIEDAIFVSNQLQKIAHDIKTDILFPNDYRPSSNHGYQTKYDSDNIEFLKRRKR
ncbi:MAG: PH domain-containing protein, partial [Anaeroplasmataceae bacterium]|nr:PH domain-containing protein [Anaeroplasmataceae bacterium]